MSFAEILKEEFQNTIPDISSFALRQLAEYAGEIERWNRTVNLTALRDAALVRRLIVEPVCVGRHLQMSGVMADVGSGNGSPGIPLCVTGEFSAAHLIEPRMKRSAFLRHAVGKLGLRQVSVHRNRIEEMPDGAVVADWIVLQAIDPTGDMLDALRRIAGTTTRVVWITSIVAAPVSWARHVSIPGVANKVWVFGLDQT